MADSLYRITKTRVDNLKNKGHDYQDRYLRDNIDENLLNNPDIRTITGHMDRYIRNWINMVKSFKLSKNPYYRKDDFNNIN